jgi:alkylation response protein AidB-like acyl-CoA dehydrogenase
MTRLKTEHLDSEEQRAFRLKARAWMSGKLPPRIADEPYMDWEREDLITADRRIQRVLWEGGLAGITLPAAYGGQGLPKRFEEIFFEEAEPYRLAWHFDIGFNVVIPTLLAHGSEYLKQRYITGMLRGDHMWCQLLSEPSGGSDLAGVLTRAEHHGDKWVLNGSKVWTTGATVCDMGICLARTDSTLPKHAGLTMFLVGMHLPGISIRPLKLIHGRSDFCQEYFDNVEVPDDHVVGRVNDGWTVATTQLGAERAGMARGWHMGVAAAVESEYVELPQSYVALARTLGVASKPQARQLIGEAFVIDAVHKLTTRRVAIGAREGTLPPTASAVSSLLAALSSRQRCGIFSHLTGPVGVAVPPGGEGPIWGLLRVATHRIGGGTLEMQRNSVAERFLGLPREPSFDRDIPFNKLKHNIVKRD